MELIRFLFSQPVSAEGELRKVLPPEIIAKVDWSTLQLEPDVTVEPALRMSEIVLCFSARFQDPESIRFILVLKSEPTPEDQWMARRMVRYMIEDLKHWEADNPGSTRLPATYQMVVYYGEDPLDSPDGLDGLFAQA